MPRILSFTLNDDGSYTLSAPDNLLDALGLHALLGDAIRMRAAQKRQAQQQQRIEVPELSFPAVGGNVSPFGRK